LATRCLFEAVMTPYYLVPPLVLLAVVAARRPPARFLLVVGSAVAVSLFAYLRLDPWAWWLPVVAGLTLTVALARPPSTTGRALADRAADLRAPSDRAADGASDPFPVPAGRTGVPVDA
jgi:hypothetical protein